MQPEMTYKLEQHEEIILRVVAYLYPDSNNLRKPKYKNLIHEFLDHAESQESLQRLFRKVLGSNSYHDDLDVASLNGLSLHDWSWFCLWLDSIGTDVWVEIKGLEIQTMKAMGKDCPYEFGEGPIMGSYRQFWNELQEVTQMLRRRIGYYTDEQ